MGLLLKDHVVDSSRRVRRVRLGEQQNYPQSKEVKEGLKAGKPALVDKQSFSDGESVTFRDFLVLVIRG